MAGRILPVGVFRLPQVAPGIQERVQGDVFGGGDFQRKTGGVRPGPTGCQSFLLVVIDPSRGKPFPRIQQHRQLGFLWVVDLMPGRILPVIHFGQE